MRLAIIGSGLGGAILADRLAGKADVTLFERGGDEPQIPARPHAPGHPLGLYPSFAYGLGGTTNYWHGGLADMPEQEMGDAWPEDLRQALPSYYERVARHLYGDTGRRAWRTRPSRPIENGVQLTDMFYGDEPFHAACAGFLSMARQRLDCEVARVEEVGDEVRVHYRQGGVDCAETFDRVVLAAGGIGSPLILARSGLGGREVGRNLTDHPMGFVAKLAGRAGSRLDLLRDTSDLPAASLPVLKVADKATGLSTTFYLRPGVGGRFPSDPYQRSFGFLSKTSRLAKYAAALPHMRDPDFLWQAMENQFGVSLPSNHAYVLAVCEQEARGQGEVSDDDGEIVIDWRVSEDAAAALRRNLDRLAGHLDADLLVPEGDLRDRLWSAAHYSGTCRIAEDATDGVVDTYLRVHGARNIHVCDGSVLPSTGSTATGLTIASLAERLADDLVDAVEGARPENGKTFWLSGANGAIGRMVRAAALELDLPLAPVDLRDEDTGDRAADPSAKRGDVFLHLANVHGDIAANLDLQRSAAAFADRHGIDQIIVPMSGSTMLERGPQTGDETASNFGFDYAGDDPYPAGKLAAEAFWLDWQAAKPGRRLALIYIPSIVGPRSAWTHDIAGHAAGKRLLVPELERFFVVSEADLVGGLADLFHGGLEDGANRYFAVSSDGPLSTALADDRQASVRPLRMPAFFWRVIGLSHRSGLAGKLMSVARVLTDKILRATSANALVPISPRYLHLFRRQSEIARAFDDLRRLDELPPRPVDSPLRARELRPAE